MNPPAAWRPVGDFAETRRASGPTVYGGYAIFAGRLALRGAQIMSKPNHLRRGDPICRAPAEAPAGWRATASQLRQIPYKGEMSVYLPRARLPLFRRPVAPRGFRFARIAGALVVRGIFLARISPLGLPSDQQPTRFRETTDGVTGDGKTLAPAAA